MQLDDPIRKHMKLLTPLSLDLKAKIKMYEINGKKGEHNYFTFNNYCPIFCKGPGTLVLKRKRRYRIGGRNRQTGVCVCVSEIDGEMYALSEMARILIADELPNKNLECTQLLTQ